MLNISQMPSSHLFGFTTYEEITETHFLSLGSALDRSLVADEFQCNFVQQV